MHLNIFQLSFEEEVKAKKHHSHLSALDDFHDHKHSGVKKGSSKKVKPIPQANSSDLPYLSGL